MAAVTEKEQAEFITDRAEIQAFLDDIAQRYLGISYREFLRRLDRGEYEDDPERPEVLQLNMLRHLAT